MIDIEEFKKIEMKIGRIEKVEDVKESKNLYKFQVNFGNEKRQMIAGLKKYYKPEDFENKQFVFVTNLKPATIMGMESQGMILAAEDSKGNVILIKPDKETENGAKLR